MTLDTAPETRPTDVGGAARPAPGRPRADQAWVASYRRGLVAGDTAVVVAALVGSHLLRFGARLPAVPVPGPVPRPSLLSLGILVGLAWVLALGLGDSRDVTVFGLGGEEYRRVLRSTVAVFAVLAVVAYLLGLDVARGYLAVAAPSGLVLLFLERWLWRLRLAGRRRRGLSSQRAVVLGSPADVAHIAAEIDRVPLAGLRVVGVCTPGYAPPAGTPRSVGGLDQLLLDVRSGLVDAVVVASTGDRARETVRDLGWALEGTGASLMVAPSLAHVAGRRIHVQPVAGVTLMHVEEPTLPRGGQVFKEVLDRGVAGVLVLTLAPVFLAVALAVRLTSPGPAFFRQERIGRGGTLFRVWKFRSMRVDADDQLHELLAAAGRGGTPLFKLDDDPRVTGVGAFIRKYSLDELPQLFNVVTGQMSLVGPRPQRAAEVELYDAYARRRLLAKPGMTGLWQVSGRSDLPWDEAVQRDVYYVENWTFTFDLVLLWKTIWTVLAGAGAR